MVRFAHVLIISPQTDVHAAAVSCELAKLNVEVSWVDSAHYPANKLTLNLNDGPAEWNDSDRLVSRYRSTWWRRPLAHLVDASIQQPDVKSYISRSTRALLLSYIVDISDRVVNPEQSRLLAAQKPYQLTVAKRVGLNPPATLITNDEKEIKRFRVSQQSICVKTLVQWRYELKETRLFDVIDESIDKLASSCPTLLQKTVYGPADIRIFVFGDVVFSARINLADDMRGTDGRFEYKSIEPFEIDDTLKKKVLEFHRLMGLLYGAYDFRLDYDGALWFFEANPDGQFLYVEIETGLPLSRAMANLLASDP